MDRKNFYDAIIVGGGPAGLTAAIYLARAQYRVLVIEKEKFGGQITITDEVVNYPGVEKTSGAALTQTMRSQAESFGAEFLLAQVTELLVDGDIKTVKTDKGEFSCFGILIATGAHPRMIGFPGESEFKGHGVAYCATCDGEFFTDKEVFVVGGGFAAAEESVFLTRYASHVTILVRGDDFTCAPTAAQAAKNHPKITVLTNTEVVEASGKDFLQKLVYKNNKTGEQTVFEPQNDTFGIFVFAGYEPETALVKDKVNIDESGYIITDRAQKTNLDGVYAAGDVCQKNLRQVVTAVGDGATAATELEKHAAAMQSKTNIRPEKPKAQNKKADESKNINVQSNIFSPDMVAQLNAVFAKMENPLTLELHLDNGTVSVELKKYMEELAGLTDRLTLNIIENSEKSDLPFVRVIRSDGSFSGLAFHGVPGGHEFTSFVLGLYNASGKGQPIDRGVEEKILSINKQTDMKIIVSLSCTMCPELVTAAQKAASINDKITAEVYDVSHFPKLKEKYNVMSVPCLVINNDKVSFGRKNISQLADILSE
ncbi:FAD-dependent oxidoreductase [Ruminococcus sp. YE282]|uniref:FAD-dependent oxidoreductase n=1 Tax=Ruminococcus sp. YE282 TaxID=3158780 RepID=UPI0008912755|nr:thioredoxin reductase (NADPH) [Ruminococcus bromii]